MEGRPRFATRQDHSYNSIDVIEDIASCDPQHREAGPLKINLAQGINACPVTEFVSSAINLNQESCRKTGEIRNVAAYWVLTSKFVALRPSSEDSPQNDFW